MNELGLRFDAVKMDTKLAEEYLKRNDFKFYSDGMNSGHEFVVDNYGNQIYYNQNSSPLSTSSEPITDLITLFKLLNQKIGNNAKLFSQLESLIRKTPEDIVKRDLKLITQNILYYVGSAARKISLKEYRILMEENTPLFVLGLVVQVIDAEGFAHIIATPDTAAVCNLFTELCHEVGLYSVKLEILKNHSPNDYGRLNIFEVQDLVPECAGVITAQSDADSAVDMLVSAAIGYPWNVRRIFVQESVYGSVMKIFEWKCRNNTNDNVDGKLKTLSANIYSYGTKTYLFDFAGPSSEVNFNSVVLVEAYRTTKELLSLIADYKPFCLSLWSSDSAESDEIAFTAKSQFVWVNDFGVFDGPSKISHALFSRITTSFIYSRRIKKDSNVDELLKLRSSWLKLDVNERLDVVINTLSVWLAKLTSETLKDLVKQLQKILSGLILVPDSFVEICNNRMCLGIDTSLFDVILIENHRLDLDNLFSVLKSMLLYGNGFLIAKILLLDEIKDFYSILSLKGAPVVVLDSTEYQNKGFEVAINCPIYQTKLVYKSFGTIFAN